jgi:exopolysaccharide/PEP-CTERM locus tyrosine autokinase
MSIIEKAVDKLAKETSEGENKDSMSVASLIVGDAKIDEELPREDIDESDSRVNTDVSEFATEWSGDVDIHFADLELEGLLNPEAGRTRLDEEYRMVKRPLLTRAFAGSNLAGCPLNLIMVTSALSGEGKTFTTMNLAISIAMEMDRTVLMIDSDLAKPSLSRHLGVNDKPGFTECLKDPDLDLGAFLLRTDVPKLTVLPAGTRNNRATELLASNTMKERLQELSSRYSDRIVLFDSPPLLATSESSVLASHMGQVAVVVEYGGTPQFLVREALSMLKNEDSVSLILNKTREDFLTKHVGGYGYGYGKGYGYGAYGEK